MRSSSKLTVGLAILATLMVVDSALAYYNPATGRFLSRDPVGEPGFMLVQQTAMVAGITRGGMESSGFIPRDPEYVQEEGGSNRYAYVCNGPLNWIDPFGLAARDETSPENWCTPQNDKGCCDCLVYSEAGGAGSACQKAVAAVMRNRQKTDWPDFRGEKTFCEQANKPNAWDGGIGGRGEGRYKRCCSCACGLPDAEYEAMISSMEACSSKDDPTGGAQFTFRTGATPGWMKEQKGRGNCAQVKVPGCTQKEFWKCNKRPVK